MPLEALAVVNFFMDVNVPTELAGVFYDNVGQGGGGEGVRKFAAVICTVTF